MLREDQCVEAACIKNQRVGVKTSELLYGIRPFYTCVELLPAWSLHFYAATCLEIPSCNTVEVNRFCWTITAKSTIDPEVKTAWKGKTLILAESCDFISYNLKTVVLEKTILRFVYTHMKGLRLEDCDLMGAARGRYNDLEI